MKAILKCLQSGDFAKAEMLVEESLLKDPDNIKFLEIGVQVFELMGEPIRTLKIVTHLLDLVPENYIGICGLAKLKILSYEYDEAVALLEQAIAIDSQHFLAYMVLADYAMKHQHKFLVALAHLKHLASETNIPDFLSEIVFCNMFDCYIQVNDFINAETFMEQLLDVFPDSYGIMVRWHFLLGILYPDNYKMSINSIANYIYEQPDLFQGYLYKAILYHKNGNIRLARLTYKQASLSVKSLNELYVYWIRFEIQVGAIDEAVLLIEKAMHEFPQNPDFYELNGHLRLLAGDTNTAIEMLKVWRVLNGKSERYFYLKMLVLLSQGLYTKAELLIDRFDEYVQYDLSANVKVILCYVYNKRYQKAKTLLSALPDLETYQTIPIVVDDLYLIYLLLDDIANSELMESIVLKADDGLLRKAIVFKLAGRYQMAVDILDAYSGENDSLLNFLRLECLLYVDRNRFVDQYKLFKSTIDPAESDYWKPKLSALYRQFKCL